MINLKYRPALYLSLIAVAVISFLAATYLPANETVKTLAAMPFVGALFVALFQIIRDHSSFERDRLIQEREHTFMVAATSHMSTVVFNKHVEFSEAYIKALQDLLGKLLADGPSRKALEHIQPLYEVRRNYRLWTPQSVAKKLDEFESKVIRMASSSSTREAKRDAKNNSEGYQSDLDTAFSLFSEIMNLEKSERSNADSISKENRGYILVIEHLQEILGIASLTKLRDSILRDASGREQK